MREKERVRGAERERQKEREIDVRSRPGMSCHISCNPLFQLWK